MTKEAKTVISSIFQMKDKVKIKPFGIEGIVRSFWFKAEGLFIEVRYFQDRERKSDFFFEDELEFITETHTGFIMD